MLNYEDLVIYTSLSRLTNYSGCAGLGQNKKGIIKCIIIKRGLYQLMK